MEKSVLNVKPVTELVPEKVDSSIPIRTGNSILIACPRQGAYSTVKDPNLWPVRKTFKTFFKFIFYGEFTRSQAERQAD